MKKYNFEILGAPDYSYLRVEIPANETLFVETGSMATMDTQIKMKTKSRGFFSRILQGENMFLNQFTAMSAPGKVEIAPGPPGDIGHVHLNNESIFLQSTAFLASARGIKIETKWQGFVKGFFSGAGLFLIRCSGVGDLWFNSFGGMFELEVDGDTLVDNGHVVAFTENLHYDIVKVGGYKSLFLSGEGLACRFTGKGKVWVQNRKVPSFVAWVNPYRRVMRTQTSN
jgi:uncharacterized protein (TIGR00266 family)